MADNQILPESYLQELEGRVHGKMHQGGSSKPRKGGWGHPPRFSLSFLLEAEPYPDDVPCGEIERQK